MRSTSNARNASLSQSLSLERKCLIPSARGSLRETLRSSESCYFALTRIKVSINVTPSVLSPASHPAPHWAEAG